MLRARYLFLELSPHRLLIFFPLENPLVRWDLDERKRAETRLKENEQSLRVQVEAIPGRLVMTSTAEEVEYVNQPTLDATGLGLEAFRKFDWVRWRLMPKWT